MFDLDVLGFSLGLLNVLHNGFDLLEFDVVRGLSHCRFHGRAGLVAVHKMRDHCRRGRDPHWQDFLAECRAIFAAHGAENGILDGIGVFEEQKVNDDIACARSFQPDQEGGKGGLRPGPAHVEGVTADGLARNRKYAVVGVFVVAAVLTQPDIISQVGLGLPILALYEISIHLVRLAEKKRDEAQAAEEASDDEE